MSPSLADVDAAENWDDDFEFTQGSSSSSPNASQPHHPRPPPSAAAYSSPSTPLSKDKKNTAAPAGPLSNWAESSPSTPSKRPSLSHHASQTENWDDDFQDADSPGPASRRYALAHPLAMAESSESGAGDSPMIENWDDDFENAATRSVGGPSPRRRTPRKRGSWPSSDEEDNDDDYGLGDGDREEDRTVTSRSRAAHLPFQFPVDSPPPPVPPLPSPFPRSPTASVFSVPVSSTGRDSVTGYSYSSTAHLALRPTVSGGSAARLALLPPSPPIHRERRRLRKKSRPPPNFEEGIFELDDRAEIVDPPAQPATPEQKKARDAVNVPQDDHVPDIGNTSTSGKMPLLSRIGSVGKKWGATRKKRASTGPSEVALHEAPAAERQAKGEGSSRPTSFIASTSPGSSSRGWFFRGGGGGHGPPGSPPRREGALKSEKSIERLLHLNRAERELDHEREGEPDSPSSRQQHRNARKKQPWHGRESIAGSSVMLPQDLDDAVDGESVPTSTLLFGGPPRRPTSMQISQSSSASSRSTGPPIPRHASYGDRRRRRPVTPSSSRASSKQRSASASVEDVHRGKKGSTMTRETLEDRSSDAHSSSQHHERLPLAPPLPSAELSASEKGKEKQKGSRRFMGGMRRISLVGGSKHKRSRSTAPDTIEQDQQQGKASSPPEPQTEAIHDQSTPRPPSRIVRSSQDILLPPIELQPPSPPRPKVGSETPPSGPGTTPTRRSLTGSRPALEPSRSHPTLSPRSSLTHSSSQETPLPTIPSPLPSPTRPKPSTSPVQTASLGRTAQPPKEREAQSGSAVLRRNSLGDLKIPARISQAQVSLRRDLHMVRDFASSVEQLKQLQSTYIALVGTVRELLRESQESQSRPVSPSFIHLPKPALRSRSNTNPAANSGLSRNLLNHAFLNIEAKYRLSWECAELLIDLGGGGPSNPPPVSPAPSSSQSAPAVPTTSEGRKSRERAITLAGDEPKPVITPSSSGVNSPPLASPSSQWRASTGRHDLSHRQLLLLREMLNNPDPSVTMSFEPNIPEEEINRSWQWGDAMNSTVTLPSEESSGHQDAALASPTKRRRTSRLGMRGLRDMLKSLKKSYSEHGSTSALPRVPPSSSSVSASTDSSLNLARESRPHSLIHRHRTKTSTGPESIASRRDAHPNSPYGTAPSIPHKSSPRRPSLASIFRLGQKSKSAAASEGQFVDDLISNAAGLTSSNSGHASGTSLGDDLEGDWDRVESASDISHAVRALGFPSDGVATVRGKKGKSPYLFQPEARPETPRRRPDASGSSIWNPGESPQKTSAVPTPVLQSYQRSVKLSGIHEASEGERGSHTTRVPSRSRNRQSASSPSPRRPSSRNRKNPTASVRSAPPQPWGKPSPDLASGPLPDVKLAMSPENIKPLLENAREVHARCSECIAELEALLSSTSHA
ncbi:hypothetical protein BD414DRAFT_470397 [Trametes punicea]|nr:hypothetical protein BD414DRAFT_470397 [Trametes punicea]